MTGSWNGNDIALVAQSSRVFQRSPVCLTQFAEYDNLACQWHLVCFNGPLAVRQLSACSTSTTLWAVNIDPTLVGIPSQLTALYLFQYAIHTTVRSYFSFFWESFHSMEHHFLKDATVWTTRGVTDLWISLDWTGLS